MLTHTHTKWQTRRFTVESKNFLIRNWYLHIHANDVLHCFRIFVYGNLLRMFVCESVSPSHLFPLLTKKTFGFLFRISMKQHLPENSCGIKTLFFRVAPFFAFTPWKILRFRKYRKRRKSSPFGWAVSATTFDLFVTLDAVLADPFELADCIVSSPNSFFTEI